MTVGDLLEHYPVSEQRRRVLMERLDAVAVIYRLASAISNIGYPIHFRWYRAMPMDATVVLPDGKTVAVVRQGLTTDRTAFSKRMWRLRELFRPSAVLMLMPDRVRLRHARRLVAGLPFMAYLSLEREAAGSGPGASIWRTSSGAAHLDLRTATVPYEAKGSMGPRRSRPNGPTSPKSFPRTVGGRSLQATCYPPY